MVGTAIVFMQEINLLFFHSYFQRAGCDNRLGSDLKRDHCGVCGGDNTTCSETFHEYQPSSVRFGYNTIARIPKYSTGIYIEQHRHRNSKEDENYLGMW
jgi:thrombospondin motif-containing protein 9